MAKLSRRFQSSLFIIAVAVAGIFAQVHFTPVATSDNNMQVFIPLSANPTINGVALAKGDEIGIFDTIGNCTGGTKWDATGNQVITVWGQSSQSSTKSGMGSNEPMRVRLWDSSAQVEYRAVAVFAPRGTTLPGSTQTTSTDSLYVINAFSLLSSAAAYSTPAAPVLAAPTNGAANQNTSLTLTWTTVAGAASYRVQLSTVSTFANTTVDRSALAALSTAITGLANGRTYYWRANATNPAGTGIWSSVWSFGTMAAPPSAPGLASPANGTTGAANALTLSWNASTGASTYAVQVSTVSTFASTVINQTGVAGVSAAATGLSYGTRYYWHVNATNTAGTSTWSGAWNFTTLAAPATPGLSSPADGATGQLPSLTLSWTTATGAASYGVQVSMVSSFATTVASQTGLARTTFAPAGLAYANTYYWHVNAINAAGTSAWSAARRFSTLAAPAAPVLTAPTNGATGQPLSLALSWATAAGAATYGVQVSTVSTFATTVMNGAGLAATTVTANGLVAGRTYYWHASATNAAGTSAWSAVWNFTTMTTPAIPVAASPANGASGQPLAPVLSWNSSAGAATYGLQVSLVSTFATTVSSQTGLAVLTTSVTGLAGASTYYWHLNAANAAGTSGWSTAWRFTTLTVPATPSLASPANGSANQQLALSLVWGSSAGAATYGVQVSTVSTFANFTVNQTGVASPGYTLSGLLNSTAYYWRANATNAAGTSVWSSSWQFATIPAQVTPTLSSPANGAEDQPLSLTMTWGAAIGATSYAVQVSTAASFASTVVNRTGLAGTSLAVGGLTRATGYYWRANATNAGGTGAWTAVWSFMTIPNAPTTPTLSAPSNGSTFGPHQAVSLSWRTVTGATSYTILISTSSGFSPTTYMQSGVGNSAVYTAFGPVFYWKVKDSNSGGSSAWSSVWSFSAQSPVLARNLVQRVTSMSLTNGAVCYTLANPEQVELSLYDVLGKKVFAIRSMQNAGSYRLPYAKAGLAAGNYILHFKAGALEKTRGIFVTR